MGLAQGSYLLGHHARMIMMLTVGFLCVVGGFVVGIFVGGMALGEPEDETSFDVRKED